MFKTIGSRHQPYSAESETREYASPEPGPKTIWKICGSKIMMNSEAIQRLHTVSS